MELETNVSGVNDLRLFDCSLQNQIEFRGENYSSKHKFKLKSIENNCFKEIENLEHLKL